MMAVSIFGSSFHLRATKCPEVLPLDSTFSRNRFWEDATTKYEEKSADSGKVTLFSSSQSSVSGCLFEPLPAPPGLPLYVTIV